MTYGIIVDSGCDFYKYGFEDPSITFEKVSLKIEIGEKEIVDDHQLMISNLMDELDAYEGKSGTAAPAPGEWLDAYDKYDVIFAITITGTLSGSIKSAFAARQMAHEKQPEKEIYIIDSLSTGPEMALLVGKLGQLIAQRLDTKEIMKQIEEYQKHTHLIYLLGHLDNLVKNGRVSKAKGIMAGILGISIIGTASEIGDLQIEDKVRGKKKACEKLMHNMNMAGYRGGKAIIAHCLNPLDAMDMKNRILSFYPKAEVEIMEAGGLCSFYMQRGGVLIGFES